MSIKFSVLGDKWERHNDRDRRTLLAIDLFEAGPVVFPASPTTSVGVS